MISADGSLSDDYRTILKDHKKLLKRKNTGTQNQTHKMRSFVLR